MRDLSSAEHTDSIMVTVMDKGYFRILQAFDPLFPIGAYTMSNGLETYVQKGILCDEFTLKKYLSAMLCTLPYNDLGFAAKAAQGENWLTLDELCTASKSAYELRIGTNRLCRRFIKNVTSLEKYKNLEQYAKDISDGKAYGCYPIAAGIFIGESCEDISEGLGAYCYSLLSAVVNHAVKLIPLRQLDGQRALYNALSSIPNTIRVSLECEISDLGCGGFGFDFRSMQHEKLYTRIYIN